MIFSPEGGAVWRRPIGTRDSFISLQDADGGVTIQDGGRLVKLDAAGQTVWEFDPTADPRFAIYTENNFEYYALDNQAYLGRCDVWLFGIDPAGQVIWQTNFYDERNELILDVERDNPAVNDGVLVVVQRQTLRIMLQKLVYHPGGPQDYPPATHLLRVDGNGSIAGEWRLPHGAFELVSAGWHGEVFGGYKAEPAGDDYTLCRLDLP